MFFTFVSTKKRKYARRFEIFLVKDSKWNYSGKSQKNQKKSKKIKKNQQKSKKSKKIKKIKKKESTHADSQFFSERFEMKLQWEKSKKNEIYKEKYIETIL